MSNQEQPFFGIDPASIEVRIVTTTYRYNQYGVMISEERTETSHREPAYSVRPLNIENSITCAEGVNPQDAIRILGDAMASFTREIPLAQDRELYASVTDDRRLEIESLIRDRINDRMIQAGRLPAELLHDDSQPVQSLRDWLSHSLVGEGRLDSRIEDAFRALGDRSTIVYTSQPVVPAACQGCKHYHGQTYGASRLICGMHPYGPDADTCPDWEDDWIRTLESPAWFTNLDFSDRQLWLDRLRELAKDPARNNPLMRGRIRLGMVRSGAVDDNQIAAFLEQVRSEE